MGNKYQEALNFIFGYALDGSLNDSESNMVREKVSILQELVDKAAPMKVVRWELAQPETRCAKCGAGLERYHDYCWGCGRKVDWSDYE